MTCFHVLTCLQLEVPKELISSSQLQDLKLQRKPCFVPLDLNEDTTKNYDVETGITQCRLSNGISVNYKVQKCASFLFHWPFYFSNL